MKRIGSTLLTVILCMGMLTGCFCRHEWAEATCITAKICTLCGEIEDEPLGHRWADATCEAPKTCTFCGETRGEPLGHSWQDATCETPKMCVSCEKAEGEALEHSWTDWSPAGTNVGRSCEICGAEEAAGMVDYLQERLRGRWDCTEELFFGTSSADLYHGKAPFLDFEKDGTIRYFSVSENDAVLLSCRMECQSAVSDGAHTYYPFLLIAENSDQPLYFWYDPVQDIVYSPALRFDRETPDAAALREMLLGKWSFDSVYFYDDTRADIDRSEYTVEFFEDGTFTANLESQVQGTWLYLAGEELKLEGETLYSIMVVYDGLWQNCNVVLEVQDDLNSMKLRFDQLRIERAYFLKE